MHRIVQFFVASAFSLTTGNPFLTLAVDQITSKNLTFDLAYAITDKVDTVVTYQIENERKHAALSEFCL